MSAWAEDIFGEDAEQIIANSEQIIEDHDVSLHVSMVIPVNAARDWLEHWELSVNGVPESMGKMLMFLEKFAEQLEEGLEMEIDTNVTDFIEDDDDWGFN
jgi:hypothetical protein